MHASPLGQTKLSVTPIGFGAFKIGRNQNIKYTAGYDLPSDAAVDRLLAGVLDLGITHIDTAPAYGTSELQIGRSLSHRRHEFMLSTKVGEIFENGQSRYDFSEHAVRTSLENSLTRLKTDVLDLVFVHAHGSDVDIQESTDVIPTLQSARKQGKVQAIGMSAKTPAGILKAIDWADVLMVEYHLQDRSCEEAIATAAQRGLGIIVKKGLASGTLPPEEAIGFVLANPHVAGLVVGGLNLAHLQHNVAIATACRPTASQPTA
ncbi:MAG: aldo/keto reductase [Planctomycetes bacterium]|nr:aldo/keto reductase [Planctomycetota bacterium]